MARQRGFTIIELMVALAIGMLITLAAAQLFITNQNTFSIQRASTEISANGRLAIDQITRSLRRAGYNSLAAGYTPIPTVSTDTPTGVALSANGLATITGAIGNSDQLVVQYRTVEASEVDCEGTAVAFVAPAGALVTEKYFLMNDTDGTPSLACDGVDADANGTVIARGVENFQLLLGVDTNVDQAVGVTRYLDVASYAALSPRPPIAAVRIGLLARSELAVSNLPALSGSLYVLQDEIPTSAVPSDRRMRRVYVSTTQLRNVDTSGV